MSKEASNIYAPYIPHFTSANWDALTSVSTQIIDNQVYDKFRSFITNLDIQVFFYRNKNTGEFLTEDQVLALKKVQPENRKDMLDLLDI